MPTGPLHHRTLPDPNHGIGVIECRCASGEDHFDDGTVPSNELNESQGLSVWDAADIWASNGKDEDYSFGFSEDELQQALDDD